MVKALTAESFNDVIKGEKTPVVVDFYADWCGPCKMMAPVIEEMSQKLEGKVLFCKINVDEATQTAVQFGIDAIPAILIFKDGEEAARSVVLVSEDALMSKLGGLI